MITEEINVDVFHKALEDGINQGITDNFSIDTLEKDLGIPRGILSTFINEDDWSFIIKCHALIESSLNQSIIKELGESRLESIISKLDTSNPSTGKVAIATSLGLLDKDRSNVVRLISEIRNLMIHNVSNIGLTINGYYEKFDKNQKKTFTKKLLVAALGSENQQSHEAMKKLIESNQEATFKYLIYSNTISTITLLMMLSNHSQDRRNQKDKLILSMADLVKKLEKKHGDIEKD